MTVHVIDEANRCLNCKKPMCRQGCPIQTPIPMMIKAFKEGDLNEAGEMLFSNNPMSMICSLVCNHEKQCEGHCVLGRKGEPVHISSIENYVSDTYFDKMKIECAPSNGKKVAVIGAGPAGITIAIMLTKKGYEVTIFDARDKIGGVLQYGIPDFRLPKTILGIAGVDVGDEMIGENFADVLHKTNPNRPNEVFAQISESRVGRAIRTADYAYSVYAPGINGGAQPAADLYADDFF